MVDEFLIAVEFVPSQLARIAEQDAFAGPVRPASRAAVRSRARERRGAS